MSGWPRARWAWRTRSPRCPRRRRSRPRARARRSPTRASAATRSRRSWSVRSSSETGDRGMAEVLVLVDHVEGEIKKATYELLTAARALGEPSAVVVGPAVSTKELAGHGAEKVYVAETDRDDFLT